MPIPLPYPLPLIPYPLSPALLLPTPLSPTDQTEGRLLKLAAAFLGVYSIALTLSPAVRARSWEVDYRWGHWLAFTLWLVLMTLAHRQSALRLPNRDPYLLPIAALLSGWGTLTIWRLFPYFGMRQTLWMLVAISFFTLGLRLPSDLGFLRRFKYLWLTSGLLLTGLTLLLGTNPSGVSYPQLWLGCCGVYLQPSEPLKFLLIVYLAAYLAGPAGGSAWSNPLDSTRLLPLLAPTFLMAGFALLLLLVQRDLGTASIFLFLYAAIVYVTSSRKRILLVSGLALILSGIAGYALFDVVRLRVDAWLNPWLDPSGGSYQIVQSLMAVANGGLLGRGPGMGNPGLVPIPHSDFIFAAITEESGLIGALGLLLLIALLAARGLRSAFYAPDNYRRYLSAGLTAHLVGQSILIIGGNLRLLPLTGVTLPFVSYGGSSLLTSFVSLLILLHISNQTGTSPAPLPDARPYLHLGAFLLAGLGAAALATGWWAIYRGPDLLTRTDNPRRGIADRYVPRGGILDRRNDPIVTTIGLPPNYTRQILHPDLSSVLGYNNPIYGQSGLEASMDTYLRGLQGYPGLDLWWNHLLYGQPPPGLDLRLSLDLILQRTADKLLADLSGALLLLNAESGEILVMASHPTYNANHLDRNWDELVQDSHAPLLNRATLGRYPIDDLENILFPDGTSTQEWYTSPQIRIPTGDSPVSDAFPQVFSPLQIALAAAALSADGIRPAPLLVTAVNTPRDGWMILPALGNPGEALSSAYARTTADSLAVEGSFIWQYLAVAPNGPDRAVTWYLGGTLSSWKGQALALALLLEVNEPSLAEEIGRTVIEAAMQR